LEFDIFFTEFENFLTYFIVIYLSFKIPVMPMKSHVYMRKAFTPGKKCIKINT